jgi:hypothetical protein
MGFYKVKKNRSIKVGGILSTEGTVVTLSDKEAAHHAENIEKTSAPPSDDAVAIFNFTVPSNSDFLHEVSFGTKTLSVKSFLLTNPLTVETEQSHQLFTGNKIHLFADRALENQRNTLISDVFGVTVLTPTTFTVPMDGTGLPVSDLAFVDYLEDLSSSIFQGKIYRPKIETKNYVLEGKATTRAGSKYVQITGNTQAIVAQQTLSVEGVFPGTKIVAVSSDPSNDHTVLLVENAATVDTFDAFASVSEDVFNLETKGAFVKDLNTIFNPQKLALEIALFFDNFSGLYFYEIVEITNGITTVIIRGSIKYA